MVYPANMEDFESIIAFYNDVIERTADVREYARWQKGKHPTEKGIKAHIQEGSMYLYKEQDTLVGAMALTMYQGEVLMRERLWRQDRNGYILSSACARSAIRSSTCSVPMERRTVL